MLALACCLVTAATAKTINVGPQRLLRIPSQAALVAQNGDHIVIDRGTYDDCAVWYHSQLTIEAGEPGVVMAGRTCDERGIFVVAGRNVTIRGITFANAKVKWHNGAGIRAFGNNLTVENCRFLHNENGILVGGGADSIVRVRDSEFIGNGSCEGACAHGLYAGRPIRLLHVTGSRFYGTKIAHHIKSRARNTIIEDSSVEDGPTGTASYLIELPNGGNTLIQNNILRKGLLSDHRGVALSFGIEGVTNPTTTLILRDNSFTSDSPDATVFVRNSTGVPVQMLGNRLTGNIIPVAAVPSVPKPGKNEPPNQ